MCMRYTADPSTVSDGEDKGFDDPFFSDKASCCEWFIMSTSSEVIKEEEKEINSRRRETGPEREGESRCHF